MWDVTPPNNSGQGLQGISYNLQKKDTASSCPLEWEGLSIQRYVGLEYLRMHRWLKSMVN